MKKNQKNILFTVVNFVSLVILTGCINTFPTKSDVDVKNQHYVSYTQLGDESLNQIVGDAVEVLESQFSPATTRFDVTPPVVDDKFGKAFYSHLLTKGFAILEVGLAKKSGDSFLKENEQLRSYKLDYAMGSTNRKNTFWGKILVGEKHSFLTCLNFHFCFSLRNGKWRTEEDSWQVFGFERKGVKNG